MGKRHAQVTNISEVEPRVVSKGTRFGFTGKRLAAVSGAVALGCGYFEVEPGKSAFPHHYHCVNEEGVYILEGQAQARIGGDIVDVVQGDYIAYPAGPDSAHSLVNTGKGVLKYLCFSTISSTEVVGYPDSKKIAAVALADPGKGMLNAKIRMIVKEDQPSLDYYEGERVD